MTHDEYRDACTEVMLEQDEKLKDAYREYCKNNEVDPDEYTFKDYLSDLSNEQDDLAYYGLVG